MNLEIIQARIAELMHHKRQLETQHKQTEQQLLMLQGHVNELQYQMDLILKPSEKPAEEIEVTEGAPNATKEG